MSDSDDDLLALADVGNESDDDVRLSPPEEPDAEPEAVNPYPLEGKYKDADDRAQLLALPEIEREEILYERAQEVQRFEERRYLAQRRRRMQGAADDGPAAKRKRGTVGVSTGTKSSLQELKLRREAQSRRAKRSSVSDDEYSEPESGAEDSDEFGSDVSDGDTRPRRGRRGSDVEWADSDHDADDEPAAITLEDVNRIRWGKTLFAKFAHHPGFADAVPGCFVRVNIGLGRGGEPVYRVCQVRRVVPHTPYTFLARTVDEAIVASMAGSERTLQFGICSDSPIRQSEFDFWVAAMGDAGIALPPRRRAEHKFAEVRALSKHALTAQEVDDIVQRRQRLSGQRGASAVLEMAELRQRRELAAEQGDTAAVAEIDARLRPADDARAGADGTDSHQNKLVRVNERNRRANVESVRKAEVQAQVERRKAGAAQKADPFSRLRTTARIFYKAGEEPMAEIPQMAPDAAPASDLDRIDTSVALAAVDDLIAQLDVTIDIDI